MRYQAGLVAVLALVLAGCGSGAASPSASAPVTSAPPVQASVPPVATPAPTPAPTPATTSTTYTVRKGDTLYAIARKFRVGVKAIEAANPDLKDPNFLRIGQKLVIPAP